MDDTTEGRLREYLKRVTTDLTRTRNRLRDMESRAHEPIAVVGMACRYPGGVNSPEDLWDLVRDGRDAVTGFPTDRGWELDEIHDPQRRRPHTSYTAEGGFIDGVTDFDPEFFGIGDAEALAMDPQHRIGLELAWEATERAGIRAETLRDTEAGVFLGLFDQGYGPHPDQQVETLADTRDIGRSPGMSVGRIAYLFGLTGPAVAVDSTSSSSLAALHMAVQSLRVGECSMAFTGGICVLPSPSIYVESSRTKVLSPTARSRSFAAGADGIHFAEGAGVVLLERLSDARRHGHPVWAVIRGTASVQGGVRNGPTALTTPSLTRMFRRALDDAGLSAGEVDLAEGHATGRPWAAGMELDALFAVYGAEHDRDRPLYLGSLKSNFGHSQSASGIGGFIKTVMAMRHGTLPPTLHVDRPTPVSDWSSGSIRLVTRAAPWPDTGRPRRAVVSSMGLNGTSGHVVVEHRPEPDEEADLPAVSGWGSVPWVLSGASPAAVRAQAGRLVDWWGRHPGAADRDIGYSLVVTRSTFDHRAVVVGDGETKRAALEALATGTPHPALWHGTADKQLSTMVFPDPGPGTAAGAVARDWPGRSAELERIAAAFADCGVELTGPWWSAPSTPMERAAADFAVPVASFAVLRSHGVVPETVCGHGRGEFAAWHCAGAVSLPDAVRAVLAESDPSRFAPPSPDVIVEPVIPVRSAAGDRLDPARLRDRWRSGSATAGPVEGSGTDDPARLVLDPSTTGAELATVLAERHVRDTTVDWSGPCGTGRRLDLPTYPFQRRRFWLAPGTAGRDVVTAGLTTVDHGVLGAATRLAGTDEWLLTGRVSAATCRWLGGTDPDKAGRLPVGLFLDLVWRAGFVVALPRIVELRVDRSVSARGPVDLQVRIGPVRNDRRCVTVHATDTDRQWIRCATGELAAAVPPDDVGTGDPDARTPTGEGTRRHARLTLPGEPAQQAHRFGLHPVLLESVRTLVAEHSRVDAAVVVDAELRTPGLSTVEVVGAVDTGTADITDPSGAPVARLTITPVR